MAKSSKSFSVIDARHWFKDRCSVGVNGSPLRGPGFICSVYLILLVIGIISTSLMSIYKLFEDNSISKLQLTIYSILTIGWSLVGLNFMYTACYICNGLRGFFLLLVLSIVVNIIMLMLFKNVVKKMIFIENKNIN
tara:strand:- start:132 stop:539 length:408 start_codon:yes stop_codon:yes gene_type:complete